MKIEARLQRLRAVMEEWPVGTVVYHRADGRRGVIAGHSVYETGDVLVRVDYGAGGWQNEMALCLSATRPGTEDGDEWRDADGKDGAVGA